MSESKNNNHGSQEYEYDGQQSQLMKFGIITCEEKTVMKQLAERVHDLNEEMRAAETLIRFLRARDCDIDKAETMLRKSAKWFEDNNVRSYRTGYVLPPALKEDYIVQFLGTDCQGHVVVYAPLGRWNIRDRLKDGYLEDTLDGRFYLLEGMVMAEVRQSPKSQFVLIVDLEQLSFYKVAHMDTINVVTRIFQDFEENYPEVLFSAYVINAPWVFPYAFSLVKPWLAPKTLAKVNVFNGNSKFLDTLTANIPEEILPSHLFNDL